MVIFPEVIAACNQIRETGYRLSYLFQIIPVNLFHPFALTGPFFYPQSPPDSFTDNNVPQLLLTLVRLDP
ncbi:hypothetical protein SCFA_780003 [anaerobic digester metagenome]|jgi:hypothetical protein|uniref:Uncharacterized protein n=1 Tax=anaerobic digester metagenome TaxID=1263854 RepID=A0A485M9X4_9ZZZZ